MTKRKIIVLIISIIASIIFSVIPATTVYADNITTLDDVIQGGDDFLNASEGLPRGFKQEKLQQTSEIFFQVLFGIGMAVSVIGVIILGIKFMAGSLEEKAEIKEKLIPFLIGTAVIFGAYSIWSIIMTIGNSLL